MLDGFDMTAAQKHRRAKLEEQLERRLQVADVLRERLFRTRIELPARWAEYYGHAVQTVALRHNCRHALEYAA